MKLTAVEWLGNEIKFAREMCDDLSMEMDISHTLDVILNKCQIAKQIEKEQHGNTWGAAIKAHEDRGGVISRSICDFDEYYNGTYEVKNENRN